MTDIVTDLARPGVTATDAWWMTTESLPGHADVTGNPMAAVQRCGCGKSFDGSTGELAASEAFDHRVGYATAWLVEQGALTEAQVPFVAATWSAEHDGSWVDVITAADAVATPPGQ